jgi:hypothetical protein
MSKNTDENSADTVLVAAAKTVGKAAGKIASAVSGRSSKHARMGSLKKGTKPVKRIKTGLPRKAKKAAKKAALLKSLP